MSDLSISPTASAQGHSFVPDASQQVVIAAQEGYHLVLAPPGCGKTQILTERIRHAHALGVPYDEMLCLTFTNRAARGMCERIAANIGGEDVQQVYVGNVHRFCSRFLFENSIVPAESSVIDEEDAISIIARYLNEDEMQVAGNNKRKNEYDGLMHLSHLMYQIEHGQPKSLRLHPEAVSADDVAALRTLCKMHRMPFDAKAMVDIYQHSDTYRDALNSDVPDYGQQQVIIKTLTRMKYARGYERYKEVNKLLDFEDLLILTYEAMHHDTEHRYRRYRWIQIDEVQDLNPLQLALVDMFTDTGAEKGEPAAPVTGQGHFTVMYLGDEQQAIFSFMGAKTSTLDALKERCQGHIHHLGVNHRSPAYLLNVFNAYAENVLHIDTELLPKALGEGDDSAGADRLSVLCSDTIETEYDDVARFVDSLTKLYPDETSAIIVSANRDADAMSLVLKEKKLPHFKVSGTDIFSTPEVKLLLAHLAVLANENNFIAWSRLMRGLDVFQTPAAARSFVRKLLDRAILPTDFLIYDGGETYVQHFVRQYEQEEMVIFDTETTGLDVFHDDIVQIAAMKIRQGEVVPGSELSLYITTDRQIPAMLGDIVNPIVEERKHQTLLSPQEALRQFVEYVGNDVLLAHNANFDTNILNFNLKRYLPEASCPVFTTTHCGERQGERMVFDSLKLVRLLEPNLKEHKLKYLLSVLQLEGENSHLADADVGATRSVVNHCYAKAKELVAEQQRYLGQQSVMTRFEIFRRNYRDLYFHALGMLYMRHFKSPEPILISEMKTFYQQLLDDERVMPVEKLNYVLRYLHDDILKGEEDWSLMEQLDAHLMDISTLKEADLCNSSTIADRIFVTTVHKAKGLEFDNVVVFDAVDGRYPNYYHQSNGVMVAEDARKFYVAMTRARRRLFVAQSMGRLTYRGEVQPRSLTPFMTPILKFFGTGGI